MTAQLVATLVVLDLLSRKKLRICSVRVREGSSIRLGECALRIEAVNACGRTRGFRPSSGLAFYERVEVWEVSYDLMCGAHAGVARGLEAGKAEVLAREVEPHFLGPALSLRTLSR